MSTKATITHGTGFHLYRESLDDSGDVYLQLDEPEFEAAPDQVTVRVPVAVWEHIRGYAGFRPEYEGKSDEDILNKVTADVDERIAAHWQGHRLSACFGFLFYGSADDPREQQIASGIAACAEQRERERIVRAKIEELNAAVQQRAEDQDRIERELGLK